MVEPVAEASPLRQFQQTLSRNSPIDPRGNRRDQTVFRERQVGNQVMELKHKSNFMAKESQQIRVPIHLGAVHRDPSPICPVEPAKKMQQYIAVPKNLLKSLNMQEGEVLNVRPSR